MLFHFFSFSQKKEGSSTEPDPFILRYSGSESGWGYHTEFLDYDKSLANRAFLVDPDNKHHGYL